MHPTQTTTIAGLRDVAPDVRELTLAPPPEPVAFIPGQWLSLHLPVGEHPPLVRAYSLAAAPSPSRELVLCLDRVEGGLGSEYLFALGEGDPVTLAGPLGRFTLNRGELDQLWLARYTGIVPFRAMLQGLLQEAPPAAVTLLYSAARQEDLAYLDEFQAAARDHSWLEVIEIIDATGLSESVMQVLERLAGPKRVHPMICGVKGFVQPLREWFHERGYERKAVAWETYD